MNISEDGFVLWSKGPSQTEADKCRNAENTVRKAIMESELLTAPNISIFVQGLYHARTNIRQNSDVDICIRYNSTFFTSYPGGLYPETVGNIPGTMKFSVFKSMVQKALEDYFSPTGVTRGNKAFNIHANTYRVNADVVPTFQYRKYTGMMNPDRSYHYLSGVEFHPDSDNRLIINWPEQTYKNGVDRNTETRRKYKRAIRIIKRLRDQMQTDGITIAYRIPSLLIECLVWNADTMTFNNDTYTAIIQCLVLNLWSHTRKDDDCCEWREVNELKYLFHSTQPWTREEANEFLQAALDYIGYK